MDISYPSLNPARFQPFGRHYKRPEVAGRFVVAARFGVLAFAQRVSIGLVILALNSLVLVYAP